MRKRKGLRGLINRLKALLGFRDKRVEMKDESTAFSDRCVMVGTVRSEEQLCYNLSKNNYHVPARFVSEYNLPVKYIALYEELNGFSGIRYFGEVESYEILRRKNIGFPMTRDNPREKYYLIQVKSWSLLDNPISSVDTHIGPPAFTTEYLLRNCRNSFELFSVTSREQYELMCRINELIALGKQDAKARTKEYSVNEHYSIGLDSGQIIIYKKHIDIFAIQIEEYEANHRKSFSLLKSIVATEDILKKFR